MLLNYLCNDNANVSRTSLLSTIMMRHANLIILPWVAVSRAQISRLAYFCIKKYRRSDDELAISNLIAQYWGMAKHSSSGALPTKGLHWHLQGFRFKQNPCSYSNIDIPSLKEIHISNICKNKLQGRNNNPGTRIVTCESYIIVIHPKGTKASVYVSSPMLRISTS